ncbi:integrase, catalytic region, zinc finger, CCHC-type containing protein [Tanacetum coccineum]
MDFNYDQLYAYLKQHEAHANKNKMMMDRFTQHTVDPLALMSNGRQNSGQGNNTRGGGAAGYRGAQNRVGNANLGQARQIKCYNCNGIGHIAKNCTQPKRPQNSEYFKDKMLLMQAQENGVALDEEQLLFIAGGQDNVIDEDMDEQPVQDLALNVDNVFQADDCDTFDSDVDEAPTAQTMFMANLSSTDPVYDEVGPSYDLDILSEVHDHDHYQDAVCEHHEEHEMHDDVQPNYVVDSHANYTSDSNMIPYEQYVKDNAVHNTEHNSQQFIFQRRPPTTTKPSGHAESPLLYAELGLTDSETESDEEVSPEINAGTQDEGQAGPNPGEQDKSQAGPNPSIQDEGQAGSNPGDAAESQPLSSHAVHAGPNLEHMDFEVTNASTQQNPEQMDEEFTTTAYPSVQENLKLPTKDQVILEEPASSARTLSSLQNLDKELSFTNQFLTEKYQEDEPDKSNTEAEVQSMVTVPIHQDTSSVPLMTTPVIDLTTMQSDSPLPTSTETTSIITTTTLIPLTPQPQQSTTDPILVRRIGELEQHMADLLQDNLALGERLDKHGTRLYNLEKLDIPRKVSQAVDEIVTDAVD